MAERFASDGLGPPTTADYPMPHLDFALCPCWMCSEARFLAWASRQKAK